MNWGDLSKFVKNVGWKRLSSHEVDPKVSNGHEFQGVNKFREVLGKTSRSKMPAKFLIFTDDDPSGPQEVISSNVSWYDSRANQAKRSAEWRLYYPAEAGEIQSQCRAGDLMVLAQLADDSLAVILVEKGSSWESKLLLLFDISESEIQETESDIKSVSQNDLNFIRSKIAEELGFIDSELTPSGGLSDVAKDLATRWITADQQSLPAGKIVSACVQDALEPFSITSGPDIAVLTWMEVEEAAFRIWERQKIETRLEIGFIGKDGELSADEFLKFSLSLRQSRVSRAGGALQNHVARLMKNAGLIFEAQAVIDNGERPDFLFPSVAVYKDSHFPGANLRLLGVKNTAKDRWRQVLAEGKKIKRKHLLTLEPAISSNQTDLMKEQLLQLVVPSPLHETYSQSQRDWLMSLEEFFSDVAALST